MLSRRSMALTVIFGLAIAGAAKAQGNGPGFHAAAFFGGGCSPAFNEVASVPTPPATVGPTTVPCLNGSSTAAGEAAATGLRASTHSFGPLSGSIGRARIQIDNVIIAGPAAASIPVSINFGMRGTLAQPEVGSVGVQLFIGLSAGLQSTSQIDLVPSGYLNKTGIFAPLALGFPSVAIDQSFVTPVGFAVPNQPLLLQLELMTYTDSGPSRSDFFTGHNGLALPFGVPVFNLPPGYTVTIPELNIVNNFVVLPAFFSGDIVIVGTNASEISLGTVTTVTGSVDVSNNTSATTISLPALETAGSVNVSENAAATTISLPALETAGSVNVSENVTATTLDLGSLVTASGNVTINDNDTMVTLDLGSLVTAGGNVTINDNDAMVTIDLGSLQALTPGFNVTNFSVSKNGPCTSVIAGSLATVTGDLTLESCGTGAYSVGPAAAGGNTAVNTAGYDSVAGSTAAGTTTITNARGDARLTVHLQASSFVAPTTYSVTRLDPVTLVPEVGVAAGGGAATLDPIAAYEITFGVPTLNRDATLTFDIFPAGLDAATAAAVLEAVTNGGVTLITRSDGGDPYQAFPVCAGGDVPTADGCILVQLLDVDGQPTTGTPAIVRFVGVTGHFSTWGVALVTEGSTRTFAFSGLLSPYPAPPHDTTPAFRLGRVVPLKFAWVGGAGVSVDSAAAAPSVRIHQANCSSLAPSGEAITPEDAGGSGGLRYDPEIMTWIFNWSTRSLAAGCFSIEVSAGNSAFASPARSFPVALRR